jgi:hypothetical protein
LGLCLRLFMTPENQKSFGKLILVTSANKLGCEAEANMSARK